MEGTTDYCKSWTEINVGLTNTKIANLTISGNNIYASTSGGGVFKAKLSDFGITDVSEEINLNNEFKAFFNQATGLIEIKYSDNFDEFSNTKIQIFSILGNKIYVSKFVDKINISNISSGVYFIKIGDVIQIFIKI